MENLQRILVAVDFSDYSRPTLRYAMSLAQEVKATIIVINVLNIRDVVAIRTVQQYTSSSVSEESYIKTQLEERSRMLEEMVVQINCPGVPVQKIVLVGVPAAEILKAIPETGANLVIVGTKGRTNLAGVLFGSVAERVYRRSMVSVLSVRGEEHAAQVGKMNAGL